MKRKDVMEASDSNDDPARGVSRRRWIVGLLRLGAAGFLGSILYPVLRYLIPPVTSEPSLAEMELPFKASELAANSGRIVPFGGKPIIVIRTAAGEVKALTATCTHLACTVQYRVARGDIWCACHNGVYDVTGNNVSGPPPRPLTPLVVNIKGDRIIVRRG